MKLHFRRPFLVIVTGIIVALGFCAVPAARAQNWRPENLTLLIGHAAESNQGLAAAALAEAWTRTLGAPVVVVARGRASALLAAGEFTRQPRDGRVVLAGDLGAMALAYARERPTWNWARSFDHLGLYAADPAVLFIASRGGLENIEEVRTIAQEQPYPVAIAAWNSVENLVLSDAAQQARLLFAPLAMGSGRSFLQAVTAGHVRLAFGRASTFRDSRREVRILASAALGETGADFPLDRVLGVTVPPAGRFDAITVHADFQRQFPERYESLKRSFFAARADEQFNERLDELGLSGENSDAVDHAALFTMVRGWWDAAGRVGARLKTPPAETQARGKITRIEPDRTRIHYLALDGKIHDLYIDPELSAVSVAGSASGTGVAALKVGMLCEIAWPSRAAVQVSRLSCREVDRIP